MQAIKVWGQMGPNPPKVAIILAELDIPHEIIPFPFSDIKKPEYLTLNPNGRLPTIQDPNTDLTLWESGAIIEYLVERYDTQQKLSFAPGTTEAYHAKQWLYFQTTGQGPYYGQGVWFKKFHHEHLPSALERYVKELNRVSDVLEGHLARQEKEFGNVAGFDGPWLVGNKLSYADLAFIPWQKVVAAVMDLEQYNEEYYPHLHGWIGRMAAREKVENVLRAAFKQ